MKFIKYILNALLMLSVVSSAKAELSEFGTIMGTAGAGLLAGGIAVSCSEGAQRDEDIRVLGIILGLYGATFLSIVAMADFSTGISSGISKVASSTVGTFNNLKAHTVPYLTKAGNTIVEQSKNFKDYITSEAFKNDRLEALNFIKTPAGKIIIAGTLGAVGAGYCAYKIIKNLDRISPIKLAYNENFLKISKDKQNKR
ncbi:hypothetical protein M1446_02030 [Candidatus Dependentiae bacterium]|nr:hypothetical protein [Candidatus Dependentiae bacterium]